MKKILIALIIFLTFFIQLTQDKISFFKIYKIDFFLIYAVILPIFLKGILPLALSLLGGLFQDSLSGNIIGLNALSKFTVSYLILLSSKHINLQIKFLEAFIFFCAYLLDFLIIFFISKWFNINFSSLPLDFFMIKYIINAAIGFLILAIVKKLTFESS